MRIGFHRVDSGGSVTIEKEAEPIRPWKMKEAQRAALLLGGGWKPIWFPPKRTTPGYAAVALVNATNEFRMAAPGWLAAGGEVDEPVQGDMSEADASGLAKLLGGIAIWEGLGWLVIYMTAGGPVRICSAGLSFSVDSLFEQDSRQS